MPSLPTGTVTFLFTDIEASTRLLEGLGDRYAALLGDYRRLLRATFEEGGGLEVDTQGDAFFVAFLSARNAVGAAVRAQRALTGFGWPAGVSLQVRMGLHTGEPLSTEAGYVGMDVHRAARICSVAHGGQILLSQVTRDLVAGSLPEDISLRDLGKHRLKDLTHPLHLHQVVAADLPINFPPLRSLDALPNNLPIQLTSFVGRERENAEIKRLLSRTRLLTLTGSGGAGKTRLAIQVAAEVLEEFVDGVWLVELAALANPALLPQTVASVMGLREEQGRSIADTLSNSLKDKHLLLLLDNCEHVAAACAQLVEKLLRTCAKLCILATSRETLGIAGETVWRVPSLSLPNVRQLPSAESLLQFEAVRLFIERASTTEPTFAQKSTNASTVAHICLRLDGIPLAIELAAARVKVLSVEQIAARLEDRFRLLTGGSRTALPQHQTLRATMDWSHALLSEPERILFRRLSAFAGGFTLDAAESVCKGDDIEERDVLELLSYLVDKSLVVVVGTQDGETRYRLLETIRQYALERLEETSEATVVRGRHRDWCLLLTERAALEFQGADQLAWLDRLETEHENLRAALAWCKTEDGGDDAWLRLVGALWWFWYVRGYLSEGGEWLESALAASATSSPARAKALNGAAWLAWRQGEYGRAAGLVEESLAISRALDFKRGIASALNILGAIAYRQGKYDRAERSSAESLALCRELGDRRGIASALNISGQVALSQGEYHRAAGLLGESLVLFRDVGDKWSIASCLNVSGQAALFQADYVQARGLLHESLDLYQELREKRGMASSLHLLGLVALRQREHMRAEALLQESLTLLRELEEKRGIASSLDVLALTAYSRGDYGRATEMYKESLTLRKELGDTRGIAESLEGLAELAAGMKQPDRAGRLLGAAEALREATGAPLAADRAGYERQLATLRASLGELGIAAAWAEGRTMSLERAIEYAMSTEDT